MRSLLVTACLCALVCAMSVTPDYSYLNEEDEGRSHSSIYLYIPPDPRIPAALTDKTLTLELEIFSSTNMCGFANVTLSNQTLVQQVEGDSSSGSGRIMTDDDHSIDAVWTFRCVKTEGEKTGMLMKFMVQKVDDNHVGDIGFSAMFDQTGDTDLVKVHLGILVSIPDAVLANIDPINYVLEESESSLNMREQTINERIEGLEMMYLQVQRMQMIIEGNERLIAQAYPEFLAPQTIRECKTLGCVASMITRKAKSCASDLYAEIREVVPGSRKRRTGVYKIVSRPEGCCGLQEKPGNHTCGPPKHGNHSDPHHPHHRPYPPPWRRPHGRRPHFPRRPIPICRLPPHHGPPHDAPHRLGPFHVSPFHAGPFHHGPHDDQPNHLDRPITNDLKQYPPPKFLITAVHPPILVLNTLPLKPNPTLPTHNRIRPLTTFRPTFISGEDYHRVFRYRPQPHPEHMFSGRMSATQIFLIVFIILGILLAINRRERGSAAHLMRVAAREELLRRRFAQRAAFKRAVIRVYKRVFRKEGQVRLGDDNGSDGGSEHDQKEEEKLVAMEEGNATERMVGEEIAELMNAVEFVSDIVGAEAQGRVAAEDLQSYEASLNTGNTDGLADGLPRSSTV